VHAIKLLIDKVRRISFAISTIRSIHIGQFELGILMAELSETEFM
jgi:hypothetical protein